MAIIAVLVAALIGPLFIDWTAYRDVFERHAEQIVGRQVKILGDADAYLLPTPSITFTDMRIGDANNPLMIVSRFSARVELAPLLKGEVKVIDMTLERPDVRLAVDDKGQLSALGDDGKAPRPPGFDPAAVAFEQVEVVDGAVQISDARSAQVYRLSDVDLSVSARALVGPFRAEGAVTVGGARHRVKLASGTLRADGAIRVKAQINPTERPVEIRLDGLVSAKDLMPRYAGDFHIERLQPRTAEDGASDEAFDVAVPPGTPWRVAGKFEVADGALSVEDYELTYGSEDRRFNLTGGGRLEAGPEPRFQVEVKAQQIDLDRMLADPGKPAGTLHSGGAVATLGAFFESLSGLPRPPIGGRISVDLPGVVVAGGAIQQLRFDATPTTDGWYISELEGQLPGRTRIGLDGEIGLGEASHFEGDLRLSVEQPAALANWWRGGGSLAGARLDPLEVRGRLTIGRTGIALTGMRLKTELSLGTGSISWRPARTDTNAAFVLDLNADRFELAQLGAAARLALAGYGGNARGADDGVTDIDVRVRVGTLISNDVEASGVEAVVNFSGDTLRIDRMILADLAGARVVADGTIKKALTTPDGDIELALTADKLGGLANLIIDLYPDSDLARRLTAASGLLGPAIVQGRLSGRAVDDVSTVTLKVNGDVGGSELRVAGTFDGRVDKWRAAKTSFDATLAGPDSGRLLGQLGFEVLPLTDIPSGRITLKSTGTPGTGLEVTGSANIADTTLRVSGTAKFPQGDGLSYDLSGELQSDDLSPLALLTGRVLPVTAGAVPARLSAEIVGNGADARVNGIAGRVADIGIAGSGTADFGGEVPRLAGDLALDAVDLRFLTELAFGADSWAMQDLSGSSSNRWPTAPFGAPLLGFVSADVKVTASRFWLTDRSALEDASFRIDLTPNGMALDKVAGSMLGGTAEAALQVKRSDAGEAVLAATLKITDGDVEKIAWRVGGAPLATGRFDLATDVNATGRSIASMVSALTGGGTLTLRDGRISGINANAFARVVEAVDGGLALEDEAIKAAFAEAFFTGSVPFERIEAVLGIASGTVRARNVSFAAPPLKALGSASLDLSNSAFESDWTFGFRPPDDVVSAAEPQALLSFRGALADPTLAIDTSPLMSYLTLRAYEEEVDKVEALQAEILERQRLTRELRRQREERARREEEARQKAAEEEARRRRAAEEEARRQREERERRIREQFSRENRDRLQPRTLDDQVRDAIRDSRPTGGGLAPLPQGIEVAPPPGAGPQPDFPGAPQSFDARSPTPFSAPATGQPLQLLPGN
ncbi:AsmA family protein [Rhodobium orientis]|uniref:AsmA family protein n=1 Tax=Rhodobium orientis TaxID=34017 RepID=UPI00237AC3B5|nr:AsmA family protein [Rhodobium orientis]